MRFFHTRDCHNEPKCEKLRHCPENGCRADVVLGHRICSNREGHSRDRKTQPPGSLEIFDTLNRLWRNIYVVCQEAAGSFSEFCFIFLFGRQVAVEGGTRLRRRMGTDPGQALSC